MTRHEILRTVFSVGPDLFPVQTVFAVEAFRMPITRASPQDVGRFVGGRPLPLAGGSQLTLPPWRSVLFAAEGLVHSVGVIAEHIISDGTGISNWEQQLRDLCAGLDTPAPTIQPLDRVAEEQVAVVQGRPVASVAQKAVPGTGDRLTEPRYFLLKAEYGGLTAVVNTVAKRNQVTPTAVAMFVVAWLIARYGRQPRVYFAKLLANRRSHDHGIECQMLPFDVLVEIDESRTVGEGLHSTLREVLSALSRVGQGDREFFESLPRVAAARGAGAMTPITFNYNGEWAEAAVGGEGAPLCTVEDWSARGEPFCTEVTATTAGEHFVLSWDVDTAMFPPDAVRQFAALVPRVVSALAEPDTLIGELTDLPLPTAPVEDCTLVGVDWVRVASVDRLLRTCRGVLAAGAVVESGELVAQLELADGVHPFDVHEHVLSQLHLHADVLAPQVYQVRGRAAPWRPASGAHELPPDSPAERDLLEAVRQVHGTVAAENMAETYVGVGGRILLAPVVVEVLRRWGWSGARPHHFTSPWTLRSIARQLVAAGQENGARDDAGSPAGQAHVE